MSLFTSAAFILIDILSHVLDARVMVFFFYCAFLFTVQLMMLQNYILVQLFLFYCCQ